MKRRAAIVLASASLAWTCAWAIWLLYWGFSKWVPDDSDGDSTGAATTILLAVTLIPLGGALLGWVGVSIMRASRALAWVSGGILALSFFSPGLFGIPYLLSAVLMVGAAICLTLADQSSQSRTA